MKAPLSTEKRIKGTSGWGIATMDGNNRLGLTYALEATRKALLERWPHVRGMLQRGTAKIVRVRMDVKR